MIRYAHSEPVADYFKLCPANQQLIDSERNIAGVMAGRLHDGTFGQLKEVTDRKSHDRHIEAEGAWQPWHAVERIFFNRNQGRLRQLSWLPVKIVDCDTHRTSQADRSIHAAIDKTYCRCLCGVNNNEGTNALG
jgi:hypothetical protein